MLDQENFVYKNEEVFIYFYMKSVDSELSDSLHDFLYEHVIKVRKANESLYVGLSENEWTCDVIRYGIQSKNIKSIDIEAIKSLITTQTNKWVASMGGAESVN